MVLQFIHPLEGLRDVQTEVYNSNDRSLYIQNIITEQY